MIRINLLPVKAAQKKEMLKGQLIVVLLAVVVMLALCGLSYMYVLEQVQAAREENDTKRFEISKLMKTIGEVNQFKKRQEELRSKLNVLDKLKEARTGPVLLLDELFKALPNKMWLTKFTEGGGKANLSGVGASEEVVALFMRNLENSELFEGVTLKVTKQSLYEGIKFQKFDITCKVKLKKPDIKAAKGKKKKKRKKGRT